MALRMLLEGNSVRSTERLTDLHRDTILKLLVVAGERCEKVMGRLVVNVPVRDVQCDEIWGYVYKKEGHKIPTEAHNDGIGDAYCFVAIERYTKLVLNFALGRRSQATTDAFIEGLRAATAPLSASRSPPMDSCPTRARLQLPSATVAISRNLSKSTCKIPKDNAGTALPMSRTRRRSQSWAILIPRKYVPLT